MLVNRFKAATILGTNFVGRDDLGAPYVKLSEYGTMVENHICTIEQAYSNVTVEKFVVMPNHVHLLFAITRRESGAPRTSRPTNMSISVLVFATE